MAVRGKVSRTRRRSTSATSKNANNQAHANNRPHTISKMVEGSANSRDLPGRRGDRNNNSPKPKLLSIHRNHRFDRRRRNRHHFPFWGFWSKRRDGLRGRWGAQGDRYRYGKLTDILRRGQLSNHIKRSGSARGRLCQLLQRECEGNLTREKRTWDSDQI